MNATSASPVDAHLATLRNSWLSVGMSDESLRMLAAAMNSRSYAVGEILIRQGEPGERLHLLTAGKVEVRVRTPAGTVTAVATLGAGDCVGEMSLLTGDVTSAEVVAITATQSVTLERTDFNALIQSHPQIVQEFVRILSRHLSATDAAVGKAREEERQLANFIQDERAEHYGDLIGKHSSLAAVKAEMTRQAPLPGMVLVHGEKGTGREAVARLIHSQGPRRNGPMISVECAQVSETPWGDKLFGVRGSRHGSATPERRARAVCYVDLAEGGTLLLREIEALPAALQDRLAQYLNRAVNDPSSRPPNVRVIASSQRSLEELQRTHAITPALAPIFAGSISLPSLRDRKRDIPELAAYFVKRNARRRNKPVEGLEDQAIRRLVSYDYRIGNVQELREAMERAVMLTDGPLISDQEIFLQPAPVEVSPGPNLLAVLGLAARARWLLRHGPKILQGAVAVFFAVLLYFCFFGPAQAERNPATLLVWSVWWPALVLSFLLVGRVWCAVCPMAVAGGLAQRLKNFKWRVPDWLKEHDIFVVGAGFLLIIWVEEVTAMRQSPFATGLLLLGIGGGAVVSGILFPRRTWCRHLCPLGGVAGLCSSTAAVELRPTADICAAKCKGHSCYKGDDQTAGCPMFNHVMFVNSNQHCVLCLNCVLSCPDGSPRLNLRVPGRELWFGAGAGPQSGALVAMMMGVVTALIFLQKWERSAHGGLARLLEENRFYFATATLLVAAVLPVVGLYIGRRCLHRPTRLWRVMLAMAPLVTAAFACYQLGYVPWLGNLHAGLEYRLTETGDPYGISFSVMGTLRVALLVFGLFGTAAVLWKLAQEDHEAADRLGPFWRTLSFAGAASYWALLLVLLVGLETLAV